MPDGPKSLSQFWQELKRRRVIHVITVYASASFVLIELVNNLTEPLNLPPRLSTIVVVALAIGFPLAIVLAWIYDLTPEGIEKTKSTEETEGDEPSKVPNAWRVATYLSFVVIVGLLTLNIVGGAKGLKAGDIQSLVVLPFNNYTGDEQLEYFMSGMHSALIGEMGKNSGLRIISETSSNTYKKRDISIPEIATELNVDAVLEATVMSLEDTIWVQFKLFSVLPREKQLWVGDIKEEHSQIINLYNRVIMQVADKVNIKLSSDAERVLAESKTVNPEAYEAYLNGKFHMGFLTQEGLIAAKEYFQKAIEIDTEYAPAYAGMAGVWIYLKQMKYVSADEANTKLEEYLSKALQLDSQDADVHYFNALKKTSKDFDWEGAEKSFKQCLEINSNFSEAWAFYSHLLMCLKRPDEMRETMKRALEIDPNNYLIQALECVEIMVESKYELGINKASHLRQIWRNNPIISNVLFVCYTETGKYDLAINELKKKNLKGQVIYEMMISTVDEEYSSTGFKEALNAAADAWVERSTYVEAGGMPKLYGYAGNTDKTMDWLEKMYIRGDPGIQYIGVVPLYRLYRNEPRYIEIMKRANLPLGEFQ
jgi:adenylate cyclase